MLLNTDMCLAWAIGDGDDVNSQTRPTKCMSGMLAYRATTQGRGLQDARIESSCLSSRHLPPQACLCNQHFALDLEYAAGDYWDECTSPVESGATTKACESTTSPDSPSGTLTVCDKQTNGMRTYVEKFANDTEVFYAAFFPAFKKLMELGETTLS